MAPELVCQNRKAFHDYFIEETFEAGIILTGSEVKSARLGRVNLKDSYARISGEEAFLVNTHISPYAQADSTDKQSPDRTRKLLLHKKEITRLLGKIKERGYTLIPTKVYFKGGRVKVELGLAKGKSMHDKRDSIKKKETAREISKALKGSLRHGKRA